MEYLCSNCGHKSIIKYGKCPNCSNFGTMKVIVKEKENKSGKKSGAIMKGEIIEKKKINKKLEGYLKLEDSEINRVFGEGIKKGGVYLLGGEPGIGKSTIVLQILNNIKNKCKSVYFSGEENEVQIEDRIKRLGKNINTDVFNAYIFEDICETIKENGYDFVIIDSIQTVYSKIIDSIAGGVSQIRYISEKITEFFKQKGITAIIIGHITKGGEVAGPKYLEHIVDGVIYLEGDKFGVYRFLRVKKNRFGPTDEVGIFEMNEKGLVAVHDYEKKILNDFQGEPGSVLTIGIDNGRPILTNIEVVLTNMEFNFPQRNSIGYDKERLNLIIAILEKHLKVKLNDKNIFLNIPGEIKFKDNGLDLAVFIALYSALMGISFKDKIFFGELTLMGRVKKTSFHNKRIKEVKSFEIIDYEKLININDVNSF